MSKYKKGDKVVIRKGLVVGKWYGNWRWSAGKEYMKKKDYIVIDDVDEAGDYLINNCYISKEMIQGLYNNEDDVLYYIKLIGNSTDVLHISDCNNHTFEMDDDLENLKCKFTEKEADEIIGSSKILYKVLV